ncbi:hypothetical protein JTB14_006746 [Gonioctena quinquepunctata]|nr:hypothetical protein JTB14_006746 [Gonioctena quinquepunctata]
MRRQEIGETVGHYITNLKNLSMPCKLNDLKEVYQNEDLRLKFLDGDHRTLDEGERYCISAKKNWKINRAITNKKEKNRSDNVDAIGKKQLTGKRNMEKALHLKDRVCHKCGYHQGG